MCTSHKAPIDRDARYLAFLRDVVHLMSGCGGICRTDRQCEAISLDRHSHARSAHHRTNTYACTMYGAASNYN